MPSGQTTLRTGRNLAPEAEKLAEQPKLRPAVSPGDSRSYESVRPDYIAPPRGESLYGQLAQALSSYVPVLDRWNAVRTQRFTEEQIAEGEALYAKNEKDFEEFAAANPEYAHLNPHLKTGYQTARLKRLAMERNAYMQNWYSTSGVVNVEDPEQAAAMLREADREWREQNMTAVDTEDARILSRAFLPAVHEGDQALMARHAGDRASEILRTNADEYSKLIATSLEQGLLNTPGIGNPDTLRGFLQGRGEEFSGLIQEMIRKGTPHSAAPKIVEQAVLSFAQSLGEGGQGSYGPQVLGLLDHIKGVDGKPLSAHPDTKARVTAQLTAWKNERRSNWEFSERQKERREKEEHRNSLKAAMSELGAAYKEGRPLPSAAALMDVPGVSPNHWDAIQAARAVFSNIRDTDLDQDPEAQREFMSLKMKAYRGELNHDGLMDAAGRVGMGGLTQLEAIINNVAAGNDPTNRTMKSVDLPRLYRIAQAQLLANGQGRGATPEMLQAATEELMSYSLKGLEEKARELAEKEGKSWGAWESNSFVEKLIIEAGKSPVFRDLTKPQDIRHTDELLSRYPDLKRQYSDVQSMRFDFSAKAKDLSANPPFTKDTAGKNKAGDLIVKYLEQPAAIGSSLAQEYGIGLADVPGLLEEWSSAILGVPLSVFAQNVAREKSGEAAATQARAKADADRRDRLSPVIGSMEKKEEDKYGKYATQPAQ